MAEGEGNKKSIVAIVLIIIAVFVVVTILGTIVLAGVVFLWAQSFTEEHEYELEVLNLEVSIDSDAFSYADPVAAGVFVEVMARTIEWDDYRVVITVEDEDIILYNAPLSSDLDPPLSSNADSESMAGESVWFTQNTLTGLIINMEYGIKFIDLDEQKVVWSTQVLTRR